MNKKVIAMVAVSALVAGIASADLSVNWLNTAVAVADRDGTHINDNLVQLIWSSVGNVTGAGSYAVGAGLVLNGEFLLAETTDHAASPPVGFWGPIGGVYTSAEVGGADINTGFFFSRVFETASPVDGDFFFDTTVVDAQNWVYDFQNPGTVYSAQAILDVTPGGTLDTSMNGTTVVPEPATFGLMGVAALGLFLARKKARR